VVDDEHRSANDAIEVAYKAACAAETAAREAGDDSVTAAYNAAITTLSDILEQRFLTGTDLVKVLESRIGTAEAHISSVGAELKLGLANEASSRADEDLSVRAEMVSSAAAIRAEADAKFAAEASARAASEAVLSAAVSDLNSRETAASVAVATQFANHVADAAAVAIAEYNGVVAGDKEVTRYVDQVTENMHDELTAADVAEKAAREAKNIDHQMQLDAHVSAAAAEATRVDTSVATVAAGLAVSVADVQDNLDARIVTAIAASTTLENMIVGVINDGDSALGASIAETMTASTARDVSHEALLVRAAANSAASNAAMRKMSMLLRVILLTYNIEGVNADTYLSDAESLVVDGLVYSAPAAEPAEPEP